MVLIPELGIPTDTIDESGWVQDGPGWVPDQDPGSRIQDPGSGWVQDESSIGSGWIILVLDP